MIKHFYEKLGGFTPSNQYQELSNFLNDPNYVRSVIFITDTYDLVASAPAAHSTDLIIHDRIHHIMLVYMEHNHRTPTILEEIGEIDVNIMPKSTEESVYTTPTFK